MRVLLTGASGFIGRNLLLHCAGEWVVDAVYFRDSTFPGWVHDRLPACVRPVRCDLRAPGDILCSELRGEYDVVVHLAANGDPAWSVTHPVEDLAANTVSTLHLLREVECRRFIYFSSGAVYDGCKGRVGPETCVAPRLPYAISNLASERYVHALRGGQEHVVVRFFGAYGPYEPERKLFTRLVHAFASNGPGRFVLRGDGRNLIDAMYVTDAVEAVKRICERPISRSLLDLGCGQPVTLVELVREAAIVLGRPDAVIEFEGEVPEYIEFFMDSSALRAECMFEPQVSFAEGLGRLRHWLARGRV